MVTMIGASFVVEHNTVADSEWTEPEAIAVI